MSENNTDKNRLSDAELENVSGGALKLFEQPVLEIQNYIKKGMERAATEKLKYVYPSLPKMTGIILAKQYEDKFHHAFTESPFYK